jgi:hypothetical protein
MNDYITKIKFISNRYRCKKCNSGSESMMFVIEDSIRFRASLKSSPRKYPIVNISKKLIIDKSEELDIVKSLRVICTICGTFRKFSLK